MNPSEIKELNIKLGQNVIIHDNVQIGRNTVIGDNCIIYSNSRIGCNSFIGPFCTIGEPTFDYYKNPASFSNDVTKIGDNCIIRSYCVIYSDNEIADNCQTGHRVTIREKTIIGHNTRIGTLSDIQGRCEIGSYVNIHSNVHICQGSVIKNYAWLFPYVILTNDKTPPSFSCEAPFIDEFAVIATRSTILPGVTIGKDALIGADSLVKKDVAPEMLVVGSPAKEYFSVRKIKNKDGAAVYPWRYSFDRGMPWEGVGYDEWVKKMNNF